MPRGLGFILLAATAGGAWSALMSRASREVDPLMAPLVAEATGVVLALLILSTRIRDSGIQMTGRGLGLLLAAGVCVFSVDYFTARGYAMKLPVSVGAPIFLAGAIGVAAALGWMLGEPMSPRKGLGLLLLVTGAALLASVSE